MTVSAKPDVWCTIKFLVIKGQGLSLNPFGAIALANPAAFRIADRFRLAVVFQITVIPPFRQVSGIPRPVLSFRSAPDFRLLRLVLVVSFGSRGSVNWQVVAKESKSGGSKNEGQQVSEHRLEKTGRTWARIDSCPSFISSVFVTFVIFPYCDLRSSSTC